MQDYKNVDIFLCPFSWFSLLFLKPELYVPAATVNHKMCNVITKATVMKFNVSDKNNPTVTR